MDPLPAPRESVLQSVREFVDGLMNAEELTFQLDVSLAALDLYPPAPVLDMGHAAGQLLERQPELAVTGMVQLISSDTRGTRAVACAIINRLARYSPAIWASMVRHLATDADWEVRSHAARAYDSREGYSGAVEFHPDWVFEELGSWVSDKEYLLRHAAAEALLGFIQLKPEVVPRVLNLLEPLLNDPAEYVRLGHVMALRTMGRKQPKAVFDYLDSHVAAATDDGRETIRLVLQDTFAAKDPARRDELAARLQS